MKTFKKLSAAILSLVMVLSMCSIFTSAADVGSITITNATIGETYYIYKVFDATFDPNNTSAVSYTISEDDDWYELVSNAVTTGGDKIFTLTATTTAGLYNVSTSYQDAVISWFNSLTDTDLSSITATANSTAGSSTGTTITFENLEYGYYYIRSTLGTTVTLTTTTPDVTVVDKNQRPSAESGKTKLIYSEDDSAWQTYNTQYVGDTNYYKLQIEATNYRESQKVTEYKVTDYWQSGLDNFDSSDLQVVLYYSRDDYTSYTSNGWDSTYTVAASGEVLGDTTNLGAYKVLDSSAYSITTTADTPTTGDTQFVLTIPWVDSTSGESLYPSPVTVMIYYTLVVDENAVAVEDYSEGNLTNRVSIQYTYGSNIGSLGTDYAFTVVYNIGIRKYDGTPNSESVGTDYRYDNLAGAEFQLTDSSGNVLYFAETDIDGVYQYNSTYTANSTYTTSTGDTATVTSTLVSQLNGRIVLLGLDAGTYTLTETKAPDGYNLVSATEITISGYIDEDLLAEGNEKEINIYLDSYGNLIDNYDVVYNNTTADETLTYYGVSVQIANFTGTALPPTGGMGTKIFYTLGGILVVAAGVLLITKRRMKADDK